MFGFVINHRFNTGPTLSECLDLLLIVPDVRHYNPKKLRQIQAVNYQKRERHCSVIRVYSISHSFFFTFSLSSLRFMNPVVSD